MLRCKIKLERTQSRTSVTLKWITSSDNMLCETTFNSYVKFHLSRDNTFCHTFQPVVDLFHLWSILRSLFKVTRFIIHYFTTIQTYRVFSLNLIINVATITKPIILLNYKSKIIWAFLFFLFEQIVWVQLSKIFGNVLMNTSI